MVALLAGLTASITHVLSGPDHLAAVTPFSIAFRKRAWIIGLFWGLGHTLGMIVIGLLFVFFREMIPVDLISKHSEQLVGAILVLIGGIAIYNQFSPPKQKLHAHAHVHSNGYTYVHRHKHDHHLTSTHTHPHPESSKQTLFSALLIGVVHGLAGFSHLVALLPSLALPSAIQSLLYLAAFGGGTILTMVAYSSILGLFVHNINENKHSQLIKTISLAGGLIAVGVGIFWLIQSF
jgi:ABC-type nickel/cobalt efflux system permease component RcnA